MAARAALRSSLRGLHSSLTRFRADVDELYDVRRRKQAHVRALSEAVLEWPQSASSASQESPAFRRCGRLWPESSGGDGSLAFSVSCSGSATPFSDATAVSALCSFVDGAGPSPTTRAVMASKESEPNADGPNQAKGPESCRSLPLHDDACSPEIIGPTSLGARFKELRVPTPTRNCTLPTRVQVAAPATAATSSSSSAASAVPLVSEAVAEVSKVSAVFEAPPSPLRRAGADLCKDDVQRVFRDADGDEDGVLSLTDLHVYFGSRLGYGDAEIAAFYETYSGPRGVTPEGFRCGFATLNPNVIAQREHEVIMRRQGSVSGAHGASVQLEELERCTVLICDRIEQALVDVCQHCRILLGPCTSSVFVRDCEHCTIWLSTSQIKLRNCRDCTLYLHTETPPRLEASRQIRLAPFAAEYPGLARQFEDAGFDARRNLWSSVRDTSSHEDLDCWTILPILEREALCIAGEE